MSTALTFLAPARTRPNLKIRADTPVDRVPLTGDRPHGLRLQTGQRLEADTVVLAAGRRIDLPEERGATDTTAADVADFGNAPVPRQHDPSPDGRGSTASSISCSAGGPPWKSRVNAAGRAF
jgi:hypothetical protein